jgi:two-component system response regulator Irr
MKLLLIEDNDMLRKSLSFFLKSKGYEVIEFDNGLDAIDFIRIQYKEIHLIVTDLNLPFAGGQQIIHATRQIKDADIQIVVLTSSGVENAELEVFEMGANDFISKPFSPAVLLKRIEKLLPVH